MFFKNRRLEKGSALTNIIIIAGLIAVSVYAVINSDKAKPGDLLYPLDESIEVLIVSVDMVSPEERIIADAMFANERLKESHELYREGESDLALQTLKVYETDLGRFNRMTDDIKSRALMTPNLQSEFLDFLIGDMEYLAKIYVEAPSDQNEYIEKIVHDSYHVYQARLDDLERTVGSENERILSKKTRMYDVEQSLGAYGVGVP